MAKAQYQLLRREATELPPQLRRKPIPQRVRQRQARDIPHEGAHRQQLGEAQPRGERIGVVGDALSHARARIAHLWQIRDERGTRIRDEGVCIELEVPSSDSEPHTKHAAGSKDGLRQVTAAKQSKVGIMIRG